MVKRDILYPIFLKCVTLSEDLFWKEIFEDLSYGNCLNGTYVSKGCYCSSIKNKEFIYKFLDKSEEKIYSDITRLLKDKLNIMSSNDRILVIQEFEEVENKLKSFRSVEWSAIKKKSFKDVLVQNFLIDMKIKYLLADIQIKKLYNFLNLGLMLKSIKNIDIVYSNGEINSIEGIHFYEPSGNSKYGKYTVNIDIYSGLEDESCSKVLKKGKKLFKDL
jgi:hypothetical protein